MEEFEIQAYTNLPDFTWGDQYETKKEWVRRNISSSQVQQPWKESNDIWFDLSWTSWSEFANNTKLLKTNNERK